MIADGSFAGHLTSLLGGEEASQELRIDFEAGLVALGWSEVGAFVRVGMIVIVTPGGSLAVEVSQAGIRFCR